MKFIIALAMMLSVPAFAKAPLKVVDKVIYGQDDRLDVFESSDNLMKELSRSTAGMILNRNLIENSNGSYTVKAETLAQTGVCKSERFAEQPTAANCSGFLVGEDLLVTAGHCVSSTYDCQNHYWVFDYANTDGIVNSFSFDRSQVYRCAEVVERKRTTFDQNDYAVLRLERAVEGRAPLKFRTEGKPANDAVMTVIGHPTGLPTKITAAAEMRNNSNPVYFVTNADTYGGNSGSAVVDSRTGIVEGILVRGDTDYIRSSEGCQISNTRPNNGGRGEDVTRITVIDTLKNL